MKRLHARSTPFYAASISKGKLSVVEFEVEDHQPSATGCVDRRVLPLAWLQVFLVFGDTDEKVSSPGTPGIRDWLGEGDTVGSGIDVEVVALSAFGTASAGTLGILRSGGLVSFEVVISTSFRFDSAAFTRGCDNGAPFACKTSSIEDSQAAKSST